MLWTCLFDCVQPENATYVSESIVYWEANTANDQIWLGNVCMYVCKSGSAMICRIIHFKWEMNVSACAHAHSMPIYTYVSISTLGCRPFNTVYSPFHSIVNISIDVMLISRFATHCEVVYGACFLINHSEWGEEPQMNIKLRPPLTIIRIYNPSPRSLIRYYISIYTYVSIYIYFFLHLSNKKHFVRTILLC